MVFEFFFFFYFMGKLMGVKWNEMNGKFDVISVIMTHENMLLKSLERNWVSLFYEFKNIIIQKSDKFRL